MMYIGKTHLHEKRLASFCDYFTIYDVISEIKKIRKSYFPLKTFFNTSEFFNTTKYIFKYTTTIILRIN